MICPTIKDCLNRAAELFGCLPRDFKGQTVRQVFNDCEDLGGVIILWGQWSDEELNTII